MVIESLVILFSEDLRYLGANIPADPGRLNTARIYAEYPTITWDVQQTPVSQTDKFLKRAYTDS